MPADTIRYGYDAGGAVTSARGKLTAAPNTTFNYIKHVGYDEFNQRKWITYGNDAFSSYAYAPDTRRMTEMATTINDTGTQREAHHLVYFYDLVGNVTSRGQGLPKGATDDRGVREETMSGASQRSDG